MHASTDKLEWNSYHRTATNSILPPAQIIKQKLHLFSKGS